MSASTTATDALLAQALAQHTASGIGGELRFVDAVFGFLRRNTKMLHSTTSVEAIQKIAMKYVAETKQDNAKPASTTNPATKADSKPASAPTSAHSSTEASTVSTTEETSEDAPKKEVPIGNGGKTDKYVWTQTLSEVTVTFQLPASTVSKQLNVELEPDHLVVAYKGGAEILSGNWHGKILSDDSTWTLEPTSTGKVLTLYIRKQSGMNWWSCVITGDPTIDVTAIQPESSSLSDLDGSTRQTVEKMMFDQRAKAAGQPTSEERQKRDALAKFMAAHPEMDFSQAKMM